MIYVSTNCLKNPKNVIKVLKEYEKVGIEYVELGSVHNYFNIKELMRFDFKFLIHNYFPPPKNPFIFNLASQKTMLRKKSIRLAKNAIDLCCEINSPLYTFHAGFTVDPKDLGKKFLRKNTVNRKKALEIFLNSSEEIIEYSKKRGIKIAVEPNVVQKFNLINGKNELLLFADYPEIRLLLQNFKKNDLGLLIDLGHLAVTSFWLKFDKNEFLKKVKNRVYAIHVSNNNGKQDQHKSLTPSCWEISHLKMFKRHPIILETMNLTTKKIEYNIDLAERAIK